MRTRIIPATLLLAVISVSCTRQEMALLLVRAAEQLGETPKQLVPTQNIADYNLTPTANSGKGVGTYYREYVRKCFSMGLIAGVDKNGTFMGGNSMTRAQAAMVIYRLLEPSTRPAVDFSIKGTTDPSSGLEVTTGSSWTEGQSHGVPKAGDKVTTKSGQTVVLQEKFGVLGFGQGIDIYTNVVMPMVIRLRRVKPLSLTKPNSLSPV